MTRIIIAGGRDFDNLQMVADAFPRLALTGGPVEIVSGTAKGADRMGEEFARLNGFKLRQFPAEWGKYGKRAGFIRNKTMAMYADQLLAFWDGESKGTKSMIELMNTARKPVHAVTYWVHPDALIRKYM